MKGAFKTFFLKSQVPNYYKLSRHVNLRVKDVIYILHHLVILVIRTIIIFVNSSLNVLFDITKASKYGNSRGLYLHSFTLTHSDLEA